MQYNTRMFRLQTTFILTLAAVAQATPPTIGNCTVLPADNIWNTPIDQLPLDANSATYVATIGAGTTLHADFGAGLYGGGPIGIPFITVPGTQTKYPATFQYADESDPGPYAVPLNAPIEGGSQSTGDRHAIAVDVDQCILYELYYAFPQISSWNAGSGAIFNLLSNALRPAGWTSADAAGLPIMPGLVRYDEVASGEIRHAIRLTVPQTRHAYIWPARHYASSLTDPKYPPMGQHFRLKASFDISSFSAEDQSNSSGDEKVRHDDRRQWIGLVYLGRAGRPLEQHESGRPAPGGWLGLRGGGRLLAHDRSEFGPSQADVGFGDRQPIDSQCSDWANTAVHGHGSELFQSVGDMVGQRRAGDGWCC